MPLHDTLRRISHRSTRWWTGPIVALSLGSFSCAEEHGDRARPGADAWAGDDLPREAAVGAGALRDAAMHAPAAEAGSSGDLEAGAALSPPSVDAAALLSLDAAGPPAVDAAMLLPSDAAVAADSAASEAARCEELQQWLTEPLWAVASGGDRSCQSSMDCLLMRAELSCGGACVAGAITVSGLASARSSMFAAEQRCMGFALTGCPAPPSVPCNPRLFPICESGLCRVTSLVCGPGCSLRDDRVCKGPEGSACDGCPALLEEALGKPCSKAGQLCGPSLSTGANLACSESGAGAHWTWLSPL